MATPGQIVPSIMLSYVGATGIHETMQRLCNFGRGRRRNSASPPPFDPTSNAREAVRTVSAIKIVRTYAFRVTESHAIVSG